MSDDQYGMWACLSLVYPPLSNQEADWVKTDPEVEEMLRGSDFYLIAIRDKVLFDERAITWDDEGWLNVPMHAGPDLRDVVSMDIETLAHDTLGRSPDSYTVSFGENRIIHLTEGGMDAAEAGSASLFEWFSTEKMIFDRGRGLRGLRGLTRHRDFATYELLYVGIATGGDTFDRLFADAHRARQSILTNEYPRSSGARVSDEMILFPFKVEPVQFRTLGPEDELMMTDARTLRAYRKRVVADVEKAFIKMLDPQYNIVKYKNYPRSRDGLWAHGYHRYGFILAENITFTTPSARFVGSIDPAMRGMVDNYADMLMVEGQTVTQECGLPLPSAHM